MTSTAIEIVPGGLSTIVAVLALLPVAYYVYLAAARVKSVKTIGKIVDEFPGPKKHWLYGNLHQHPGTNDKGMRWLVEQLGRNACFRLWFGPLRCTVLPAHPAVVKTILRSSEPKQLDGFYGMMRSWLGDGLLLSSGSKWLRNRRLLTPAFHFDVLKPYMKVYNEAADIFLDKLELASKSGSVEISQPISLLTLNIILRCAFSSDIDVQRQGKKNPYVEAVIELTRLFMNRCFNPLMYIDFLYSLSREGRLAKKYLKVVHGISENVIAERKRTLKETQQQECVKRYPDFLDILLLARDENNEGLTDSEIRDEVDTFLFEGHDTTSSAILWVLYEMARNPDHQQHCRDEIDRLVNNRDDKDIEWGDLAEMSFTTQCIRETMRLHSPVPFISRQLTKEFELDGVKLLPGTFVDVAICVCHHNGEVWGPDHNEFKPERFDPDKMEQMDPFAFLPFSAGPRNCIGQNFAMHEIKVVVSKVLHRFVLSVDTDHPVERLMAAVTRAAHGIKLFLKSRS